MLLAVDIGNTQTTAGLFEDGQMRVRWAVTTRAADTPDELHQMLFTQLALSGLELSCIDDAVIASVVLDMAGDIVRKRKILPVLLMVIAYRRSHWEEKRAIAAE